MHRGEQAFVAALIAFDVNETVLGLRAPDRGLEERFASAAVRVNGSRKCCAVVRRWPDRSVHGFNTAQRAALRMIAERAGRTVTEQQVAEILERMSSLPPRPEASAVLDALNKHRQATQAGT
jgi:2-haloacid dehalogenase